MKILFKPKPKHPHHHRIWKSIYFYISMDFPITLPTHQKNLDILEINFAPKFISSWIILGYNEDTYHQGGLQIKARINDDFITLTILLYKYGLPYLPTYHKSFCPNFFFGKSMAGGYSTYLQFGHMSEISQAFFLTLS